MRKYLFLLIALVAVLGGCSRCEREDIGPRRTYDYSIFVEENGSLLKGGNLGFPICLVDMRRAYRRVNTFYRFNPVFTCSDTAWDIYEWRFGNGQVFSGKRIGPYFLEPVSDTVTLHTYTRDRKDSAKAGMRFYRKYVSSNYPHLGRFTGRLYYLDRWHEQVPVTLSFRGRDQLDTNYTEPGIFIDGLFSVCGCPDAPLLAGYLLQQDQLFTDPNSSQYMRPTRACNSCTGTRRGWGWLGDRPYYVNFPPGTDSIEIYGTQSLIESGLPWLDTTKRQSCPNPGKDSHGNPLRDNIYYTFLYKGVRT